MADWIVDPAANRVSRGDVVLHLEPRVMDLLIYLAQRKGEVVSRARIYHDVWQDADVGESALLTAISALRRALADNPRNPTIIETVPKRGYRFIASTSARTQALAVLPFRDVSLETNQQFLADGISEMLLNDLGRSPGMRVISWASVSTLRDTKRSMSKIAQKLGVRYVVDGTVWCLGNRVRVTVRLNDTIDNSQAWADSFESELSDLLRLQRDFANRIAHDISGRLKQRRLTHSPAAPESTDALIAYLRGRFHWYKMSPEHFHKALEYFEQSVDADSRFGPAYAGISDVWGSYGYWGMMPPAAVREQVWAPLLKAQELDEEWAEIYMLKGVAYFLLEHDWNAAEAHLQQAIELNPNLAHAHLLYGLFTIALKRADAVDWIGNAARLDPLNPAIQLARALLAMSRDRQDEALRYVRRVLEVEPAHPPGNQLRANLAWHMGDPVAIQFEARIWAQDPDLYTLFQGKRFKAPECMRALARSLQARSCTAYVQPMQIARVLMFAGEPQSALDVLEAAFEDDDLMQIDFLQSDCVWHPLRSHRRFKALLEQIGLPTRWE